MVTSKLFDMEKYFIVNVCIGMLLFSIVTSVTSHKIHEDMTREEMLETFHVIENLPEYEIVPIHYSHVNKRAIYGRVSLHLKPFGKEISLWLDPAEGVLFSEETAVYTVSSSSAGLTYTKYKNVMEKISPLLYTNFKTYTTMAVSRGSNNGKRMTGVIGSENLIVRPVPDRFYKRLRYSRSIDEIPESEQNDHHYHIVYKSAMNNTLEQFKSSIRMKRAIQDTVYPEILVIVDNNLYKALGRKMSHTILYLMAFWNGVDMMYRSLESPKFRLNIAAIILVEDNHALDYISSNQIGSDRLAYNKALDESQYWLYEKLPQSIDKNSYDVAATMTTLDFCDFKDDPKQCKLGTLGVAYVSSTCGIDDYFRVVTKTILVHDNGAFNGITTAGHELGHSFGAYHDGEKNNIHCSSKIGNIMAAHTSMTKDAADWSKCTQVAFDDFLKNEGKCLYNQPKYNGKLPRLLPGKMKDAHKQCELLQGTKASDINESICHKLRCFKKNNDTLLVSSGGAVDGTPCGDGKMCLHKKCILESSVTES